LFVYAQFKQLLLISKIIQYSEILFNPQTQIGPSAYYMAKVFALKGKITTVLIYLNVKLLPGKITPGHQGPLMGYGTTRGRANRIL
jgi:hypothetical protein